MSTITINRKRETMSDNQDLNKFLDAIDIYLSKPSDIESFSDNIIEGLKVFLELPSCLYTSLYLINEESYEFDHRLTLPSPFTPDSLDLMPELIERGLIGKTLQAGEVIIAPHDTSDENKKDIILAPLLVTQGVMGLALIITNAHSDDLSNMLLRLCSFHSKIYANALERSQLFLELKDSKSQLEQKVAVRTMDLAQSKYELKAILDSVHTGIMVVHDKDDKIFRANPVAVSLVGESFVDITSRKASDFLKTSVLEKSEIQEKTFESELRTKEGNIIPILRTISRINLNGERFRIESFWDITEQKIAENALRESNQLLEKKVALRTQDLQELVEQLKVEIEERQQAEREAKRLLAKEKELSDMKTTFVNMVSHEFRTPLTVIKSAAQFLDLYGEKLDASASKDYLKRVMSTVDFMTELIENILFIGKAEVVNLHSQLNSLDLVEFSKNLVSEVLFTLKVKREIKFETLGEPRLVSVDARLLKLVLNNVISNGLKYSSNDTVIEISLSFEAESFEFIIKDYGIGIPSQDQDKVFEIFHRSNNVGDITGSGLGMSVVKQALNLIKGKIRFESELDKGTTFYITIPHKTEL